MKTLLRLLSCLCFVSGAWTSEPGQPLDCSDMVMLRPGLTCQFEILDCTSGVGENWCAHGQFGSFFNNENERLMIKYVTRPDAPPCGGSVGPPLRFEIVALRDRQESVIAYIDERCGQDPLTIDALNNGAGGSFDSLAGSFLFTIDALSSGSTPAYPRRRSEFRLDGFATLFEIFQQYAPPDEVAFRVPAMPEAMPSADRFDTYYGPLTGPKNFSQAQPLRCNYPATIPQPGDYLEAGVVPDPPSRQGYYYVTAATYQGETRYGRKRENGVLSGRDPAGLPPCVQPLPARDGASVAALRRTP